MKIYMRTTGSRACDGLRGNEEHSRCVSEFVLKFGEALDEVEARLARVQLLVARGAELAQLEVVLDRLVQRHRELVHHGERLFQLLLRLYCALRHWILRLQLFDGLVPLLDRLGEFLDSVLRRDVAGAEGQRLRLLGSRRRTRRRRRCGRAPHARIAEVGFLLVHGAVRERDAHAVCVSRAAVGPLRRSRRAPLLLRQAFQASLGRRARAGRGCGARQRQQLVRVRELPLQILHLLLERSAPARGAADALDALVEAALATQVRERLRELEYDVLRLRALSALFPESVAQVSH
mmetsp:Transcript_13022/g.42942  ORF Transcript_13022/g.42942 Transcript_13022/m.42942 type:complete len:292 (-) Transcript_13022:298-1173(-)